MEILIKQKRKKMFKYKLQVFSNKYPLKSKILIVTSVDSISKINKHFKKWWDLGLVE